MRPASDNSPTALSFAARERQQQTAYFEADLPGKGGYRGMAYRLYPEGKALNLAPAIRDCADRYFRAKGNLLAHTLQPRAFVSGLLLEFPDAVS